MEITRTIIKSSKITKTLTVAVAADLHNKPYEKVIRALKEISPSMIVIPGDLMNNLSTFDSTEINKNGFGFLLEAVKIAPVFYTPGNHELTICDKWREKIRETGAVLLDNESAEFGEIKVCGLSSGMRVNRLGNTPAPSMKALYEAEKGDEFKLLLSHHPEYYKEFIENKNIDLTISGHAHGGQWRAFGRGFFAPGQGVFPKYTAGLYDGRLYVSRGLANTAAFIPRFFNRRELAVITLSSLS